MNDKDKRTYKSLKEHANDMSYENEVTPISNDDRGTLDLTRQIDDLNRKVKNLDGLEKIHKETNGDLRVHIIKLDKEIYQLKKDNSMIRETCQVDLLVKDNEIGRLMKKLQDKG
tara:strand:+ start:65 stop:406 length:342 start_codon:yes stop_codon:yes gene_type:complete